MARGTTKKSGKKGSIEERHSKVCEIHERNPCAPKIEKRTQDETLHQERYARRVAWDLATKVKMLKDIDKSFVFYSVNEARTTPALQNLLWDENSGWIPEHQCTC